MLDKMKFLGKLCWIYLLATPLADEAWAFEPEQDAELWAPTFIQAPTRSGWTGLFEINSRVRGDMKRLNTLILRPWIGHVLVPGTAAHAGYGWIRSQTTRVMEEHRAWAQTQTSVSPGGGWILTVRPRLEQRWLETATGPAWRVRLFMRGERKLGQGPFYGVGYQETFVRLGSTPGAPRAGFDQQRLFVGVGRDSPQAKLEAGYQYVRQSRPFAPDRSLHCLVVNSFLWPWGRN